MAGVEDNLNTSALNALATLDCPVCYEELYSPVFQCANGHLICSSCLDKINRCPTCREVWPIRRTRNLVVENLVSLKCPNLQWGCKARFSRRGKAEHLLICEYRSRDYCSHLELSKLGINCNQVVSKLALPAHFKNEHKLNLISSNKGLISQELDVETLNGEGKWFPVVFSAFNDFFFVDCEITGLSDSSRAAITWKCISAGSVSNPQKFFVTMTIIPVDKGISSLKWEGKVTSIDELQGNDLNYFSLNITTLRELTICKTLDKLSWKINIVIEKMGSVICTCFPDAAAPEIKMNYVELVPSIYRVIEGTWKPVSGTRWWGSTEELVYYRKGSLWTRKVKNFAEYTFTFGQEVVYQCGSSEYKSTATIENNKLIHRTKMYRNEQFCKEFTEVEEFTEDEMLATDTWDDPPRTSVYKKVNGK